MKRTDGPLFDFVPPPPPGGPTYLGHPLLDEETWKREFRDRRAAHCPTCGQATVDRIRVLGHEQVRALAILHGLSLREPTGWVHRSRIAARMPNGTEMGGELARLRYWDLSRAHLDERGMWQTTARASAFLTGGLRVPAKMALADWKKTGKFLGFFAPLVAVGQVMKGADFDLDELLDSARASLKV